MIKCTRCNSENENDSLFCGECGNTILSTIADSNSNSVTLSDIVKNKFFTFAEPFISKIDGGQFFKKPFRWLYIILAILNILVPIYVLYKFIDEEVFNQVGFSAVVVFLFWTFAFWMGFQLWWDRKSKINKYVNSGDEFLAIPVFSHFIQTLGEWFGIVFGIISVGIGFAFLFSDKAWYLTKGIDIPFFAGNQGALMIIIGPVYAFFVVVFTRFIAESIRALASIANNTKKLNSKG